MTQMTSHTDNLRKLVKSNFPDAAARVAAGKAPTKRDLESVATFVLGWALGLEEGGQTVPPIVILNLQCGRCDRFLE